MLHDSNLNVFNNSIMRNENGIMYEQLKNTDSNNKFTILNNIIANNSMWGIYSLNYRPEIDDNVFIDDNGNPNNLGIFWQEFSFTVYVKDLYNNPKSNSKVIIKDKFGRDVTRGKVPQAGELHYINLTEYKLLNDNNKIFFTPHSVEAKWGYQLWEGYVSNQTSVEIHERSNIILKFYNLNRV